MEKDGIKLEAQSLKFKRTVEYTDVLTDESFGVDYMIEEDAYTVDEIVDKLYDEFNQKLSEYVKVEKGVFGADMKVSITNDGPVTIILESR